MLSDRRSAQAALKTGLLREGKKGRREMEILELELVLVLELELILVVVK